MVYVVAAYGEFDGLLGCDAHQLRHQSPIQTEDPFVSHHFLETIETVPVHQFTDEGARSLVLHTRLHQIYRVHRRCTDS